MDTSIKVNLSIVLQGSTMLSEQECSKQLIEYKYNKFTKKKEKICWLLLGDGQQGKTQSIIMSVLGNWK